ncbi:site-specific integrase [bacterium]|nr:site-specific integrase [bacterium]
MKEVGPRKWRASWTDPLTKKHVRRILPASGYREAEEQAKDINSQLAVGKGFGGRLRGSAGHSVSDAVLEAVKHSNANQGTRKDYLRRYNPFAGYLTEKMPGVRAWSDVTTAVLHNYIQHCRQEDLAPDSLRMRVFVLRMTSRYMAQTYPDQYRDVAATITLSQKDPTTAELRVKDSVLSPEQLRALLTWLKQNDPMVYTWAVLQSLCGVRVFEAAYLREEDFAPGTRSITITASPAHKPKNRPSYRTIPICKTVDQALRDWILALKIRHHAGYLFFPSRRPSGRPNAKTQAARADAYTQDRICHLWRNALANARRAGMDLPEHFVPKKLRDTFVTHLRKAGVDFAVLQSYIGHAPSTVLSAHYDHVDDERLRQISGLAQDLFEGTNAFTEKVGQTVCNSA